MMKNKQGARIQMKTGIIQRLLLSLALAMPASLGALPAAAEVRQLEAILANGITIDYKLVTPAGYDPARAYPAILAFPGGRQSLDRVDTGLQLFWRVEAERRGFMVISPAAPEGGLFFRDGDKAFPEFLEFVLARHKTLGGKFHLAGVSNGGRSAFHIAARHPSYFTSILALPGFLPEPTTKKYAALAGLCVVMIAGERDRRWIVEERRVENALLQTGGKPLRLVSPSDGHLPVAGYGRANAGRLFDFIESKAGC